MALLAMQTFNSEHFLYPGSIFMFLLFVLLFVFIFKHGLTFENLVSTANTLGSQPMALLVLVIGIISMRLFPDSNVSAGIIGCALGLLNNQFAKQHSETTTVNTDPPTVTKTVTTEVGGSPTAPVASKNDEVQP